MLSKYSIVVCPPFDHIEYVKGLKEELFRIIGWYSSSRSQAHITVVEFEADEVMLQRAISYLEIFCQKATSTKTNFTSFGIFPNGAFYLAPDTASKAELADLMRDFSNKFPLKAYKSTNPHMTIARQLSTTQLQVAKTLFEAVTPDISFEVDALWLRKFNEERKQYDLIVNFPFHGTGKEKATTSTKNSLF
jgi:2'-5' RNA ligase